MTQKSWTHGLIISDIAHMPGGICGVWPARKFDSSRSRREVTDEERLDIGA